ncbi:Rieske (2Fe-2S) protein, partial [Enterococcus faecium]
LGAPTAAPIDKIEEGQQIAFVWRGQNVWVLRRSQEMIGSLSKVEDKLQDPGSESSDQPKYCMTKTRSIKPEYMVMTG